MPAYKDPKKGTWVAKFNYKDNKGNTRFTTKRGFSTKREAIEFENEFKKHIAGNLDMKFEEFVKLYREDHYSRIRVSTAASKDNMIDHLIIPYFKNYRISEIKARDVVKWQNELISYRNPTTGKPYAKTYLKSIHNQMSAIMNYAVRYYELKENPAAKAGAIGLKDSEEMQFWTFEEYKKFSEQMMEEPFYYYCFEMLYWTGIREGELLALTVDDFDFTAKTVSITKTYQIVKGKEIIGPTKTAKGTRIVNMPNHLCEEIQDYLSMIYDKSDRMFPTSKYGLAHAMKRGAEKAGVKRIRIHDIRHSHVSLLIRLGFGAVDIAKRVGHESITITLRYAHMFPSVQEQMMGKLDNLMNKEDENV